MTFSFRPSDKELFGQLIEDYKKGQQNERIFKYFYEKYRRRFLAYIYKWFKYDTLQGEDIYHDTWATFLKEAQKGRIYAGAELSTILIGMGRNICLNAAKKEKGKSFTDFSEDTHSFTFEHNEHWSVLLEKLETGLENLGEECQTVLALRFGLGTSEKLPREQIAIELGFKNKTSVSNKLQSCYEELKIILEKLANETDH